MDQIRRIPKAESAAQMYTAPSRVGFDFTSRFTVEWTWNPPQAV